MVNILFNSVSINAKVHKEELLKTIGKVIKSGIFLKGGQNQKLTKNLTKFLGGGYVTNCASGHDALSLALASLNLTDKDEIIFPVNSYPTAFPVGLSKARLVPVDVDLNGQLDPKALRKKITKNTKAIILVHLYGLTGNIEEVKKITKERNITLIEDCAQAFGSRFKGIPLGTIGDISCFSFYPTKNLTTLGDGGAVWTKRKTLADFFRKAVSYGESKHYYSEFVSFHSRLPEIQAGIVNSFFVSFKKGLNARKKLFKYYKKKITGEKLTPYIRVLNSSNFNCEPATHLFVVEVKDRDRLRKYLQKKGIETYVHYPYPIHLLPAFSYLKLQKGDFPMAERLCHNIVSLPFHQMLKRDEIDRIVNCLKQFYG